MVKNRYITRDQAQQAYGEDLSPPAHMFTAGPQVLADPAFVSYTVAQLVQLDARLVGGAAHLG